MKGFKFSLRDIPKQEILDEYSTRFPDINIGAVETCISLLRTASDISKILDEHFSNPCDQRGYLVRLSSKGLCILEEILPVHYTLIAKLMSGLEDDQLKELTSLLNLLSKNLQTRMCMVDLEDVAEVASIVLTSPGYTGVTYELSGPENLSLSDMVEAMELHLGREIKVETPQDETFAAQLKKLGAEDYQVNTLNCAP